MSTTDDGPATTPASSSSIDATAVSGFVVRDQWGHQLPPVGRVTDLPDPKRTEYRQTFSHECEICGGEIEVTLAGAAHQVIDEAMRPNGHEYHAVEVSVSHAGAGHVSVSTFVL